VQWEQRRPPGASRTDVVLLEDDPLIRHLSDVRRGAERVANLRVRPAEVVCQRKSTRQRTCSRLLCTCVGD
jgi:hypothetical protein